ncbi:MAG: DUF1501 domain-containing protein [Gemmataceae bacterium]|nr:DUF1501 domain-containing protein [Gemmataceae bacterium]
MLNLIRSRPVKPKCDGTSRREFLQAGILGLGGLTLADLFALRAHAAQTGESARNTSVVLLFLDGGAPQHETFDPKPDAPREYRSIFGTVQTRLPGVLFGSHFTKLARVADRIAILRTLVHGDGDHGGATHWMKTGMPWPPEHLGKAAVIPQQSPSIGSAVARTRGTVRQETGVPTYVRLLSNHGGYPGDDAVWLGQAYSPFRVGRNRDNPMLDNMSLRVDRDLLDERRSLLQQLDTFDRALEPSGLAQAMDGFQQQAVNVLLGRARQAFDISLEPASVRDRYGPGLGQELLLARRLCEAGAGFVTLNNGYWDFHGGIIPGCNQLCPPLDHAVSVFMEDVRSRGLEDDILLVVTGEFGRTPRINGGPGRDHWAPLNDALLIGGGLRMGQVIGESDSRAANVRSRPITPGDLFATILQFLGIDPGIQFTHPSGRPVYMIEDGRPMAELVG